MWIRHAYREYISKNLIFKIDLKKEEEMSHNVSADGAEGICSTHIQVCAVQMQ